MATADQRQHLAALMHWTVQHNGLIHYSQQRPIQPLHLYEQQVDDLFRAGYAITFDCSGGVTCLCKWAGLADPNGRGYDGYGFTGTLLGHLPHYSDPSKAGVGALAVFGPGSGEHVAMVLEPGRNPLLWSHGSEAGPLLIHLNDEARVHSPPVTLLNISKL